MKQLNKWLEEEYQLDIKERERIIANLSITFKCLTILIVIVTIALIPIFSDYGKQYILFPLSLIPFYIILTNLVVYLAKHNKRKIRKLKKTIKKELPTEKEQLEFLKEMTSHSSKKVAYTYGALDNHIVISQHFMLIKTYRYILVDLREIEGLTVKLNKYSRTFFHCNLIIIQSGRRLKAEIVSLKAICEVLQQLITVFKALNITIQPNVEALMDKVIQDQEKEYTVTCDIVK